MESNLLVSVILVTSEAAMFALFFFSDRLKAWADVVCSGLFGVFVHTLLLQFGNVRNDEWDILSATLFALSFSLMRWTSSKQPLSEDEVRDRTSSRMQDHQEGFSEQELHNDRLRTMGLMSARFAHEIATPLSTLQLRFEEMRKKGSFEDQSSFQKSLASMEKQLKHLMDMTRSIRIFAAPENATGTSFIPVEKVFHLVKDMSDSLMTGNGNVSLKWPENIPPIGIGGGLTLQSQVLVNLVKNAIDAVAELEDVKQRWVSVDLMERGGSLEIAVSNGGPAVSRVLQSNLFKPFFTTKKTGAGMGLGLSLCREMVESVGGEIWYDEHSRHPRFVVRYSFLPDVTHDSEQSDSNSGPTVHQAA